MNNIDVQFDSTTTQPSPYKSLEEIRMRKEALRSAIRTDDQQIKTLWADLFHKPDTLMAATPSKRISGLMSTGAGLLDGLILGWKLYKKFKGNKLFKKR